MNSEVDPGYCLFNVYHRRLFLAALANESACAGSDRRGREQLF